MKKKQEIYIWIIVCSMSTFFTFGMNNEAMNNILIGVMSIVPFFLIFQYPKIEKNEILFFILFVFMAFAAYRHNETFRISTILYSLMYILTFIYYYRLLSNNVLTISLYERIIKFLLWIFFITLIIQQFCAIFNVPIFNYRIGDVSTIKFNSLASEPSYFGKIIVVLMLSYISIREVILGRAYNLIKDSNKDKSIWFLFLYQIFFCGSSFAILLLFIFLLKYIKLKTRGVFLLFFVLIVALIFIKSSNIVAVERVSKVTQGILTFDEDKIFAADASGAFRVVPSILYIKKFNAFDVDLWLGKGIDYTRKLMPNLMPALDENDFSVGLFPAFIWDSGIISTILLIYIVLKFSINKKSPIDFILWFVIILDAPFNTQLFWITLILMTTNKFLQNKYQGKRIIGIKKKHKTIMFNSNNYA